MVAYPIEDIARATRRLLVPRLAGSSAPPRVEHVNTIFFGPSTSSHEAVKPAHWRHAASLARV